jgi:hypothetical protein
MMLMSAPSAPMPGWWRLCNTCASCWLRPRRRLHGWLGAAGTVVPDPPWFPAMRWQDFIVTLMIAGLGGALGFS